MLGALRTVFAVALLVAGLVAGCGGVGGPPAPLPPAEPATGPPGGPAPAGSVLPLPGAATAVVIDSATATVVTAVADPPQLLLHDLDGSQRRQVPLPGPAADLTLPAEGGPLLVTLPVPGSLVEIPLDGGAPRTTGLDGMPRAALAHGDEVVVALGDRLAVLERGQPARTVTDFADAAGLAPAGSKVAVLDRGRVALSLVDVKAGEAGPALRAGNGAARAVADRFGRILVTDVRDGELLVFAGDPLLLRQRYPLPGAPYGLAYDSRRDLVWITLTARNEVVGLDVARGEPVIAHRFPTLHQPDAVAVDPVSGRVVVASASGAGLQMIDPGRVVD